MAEYVVLVRMKDVSKTNIRGLNLGSLFGRQDYHSYRGFYIPPTSLNPRDDFAHVLFGKLADARKAESYYSRNPAESYTVKVLDFSASGVWTGPPIVVPPARSAPSPVSLVPHAPSAPTSGSSVEVEDGAKRFAGFYGMEETTVRRRLFEPSEMFNLTQMRCKKGVL